VVFFYQLQRIMIGIKTFITSAIDNDQRLRDKFVTETIIQIQSGSSLIDIGAGGGPYKDLIAEKGIKYTSQDFGQLPDEILREGGYSPIDVVSDATSIPLENEKFDACLCTEVLEHVPDTYAVVSEISRLLKKNGIAIITVPRISPAHQLPYCFVSGFHEPWVVEIAKRYNFKIEYCDYPTGGPSNLAKLSIAQLAYNLQLIIKKSSLAVKCFAFLSLPFAIISSLTLYLVALLIDRFDKNPTYSYGLHIILKKKF